MSTCQPNCHQTVWLFRAQPNWALDYIPLLQGSLILEKQRRITRMAALLEYIYKYTGSGLSQAGHPSSRQYIPPELCWSNFETNIFGRMHVYLWISARGMWMPPSLLFPSVGQTKLHGCPQKEKPRSTPKENKPAPKTGGATRMRINKTIPWCSRGF